jgi:hypothetical protein
VPVAHYVYAFRLAPDSLERQLWEASVFLELA